MIEQFRGNIHWKLGFYNFNIDIQRIIEELFTENWREEGSSSVATQQLIGV